MLAGLASSGESLLAKVKAFNHSHDTAILTNFRSPSSTPQTPSRPGRGVARTMAQPVFDSPNAPMNLSQMGVPVQLLPLEDFHSTIELFGWVVSICFLLCFDGGSKPFLLLWYDC